MAVNLTNISSKEWQPISDLKPVLQVIDIRPLQGTGDAGGANKSERFRMALSDGKYQQQGMLATQNNDLVTSHQLQKGSVVQLTEFVRNSIKGRCIIIIVELNVILSECDIIGDPKPLPYDPPVNVIPSTQRAIPPMQMPTYSYLNEPRIGSVYSSCSWALSPPNIDSGNTTIELNNVDQHTKKTVANKAEMKKRAPTIDECYDKLKGLRLEATNPIFLAAFVIFSQPDNCRESWMTLPSDPEVLKNWIAMMAKSLGIMI